MAYKSLPASLSLEYAVTKWDPSNKGELTSLELVQNQAIRFIAGIKGTKGISDAMEKLDILQIQQRRQQQRLRLLMRILSREEVYSALMKSYDEIMSLPDNFIKTRAQSEGQPTSIQTNDRPHFNSFQPRTIRELIPRNQIN